ncbi:thioesterase domain-containing protein [Nocardia sp. NBC_01730]|uniref:thioesterase domain-containing protein n=1 Tax=Nocardia sp. NBC_01730 TaxID=2975998 RepID=UPI002E1636CE|nr:thioesterase domain-containing protein [Nocardia sp. NBC_01730]
MTELARRLEHLSETKRLALRRLLADKNAEARLLELEGSSIKVLRQGTPKLFIFPATEGSVAYMNGYLPHIPAAWGVYGCQTPGLDDEQKPATRVEDIATQAIRGIRSVQPRGPYYLAGNCMGGLPAFETARQLEAAGETVAVLVHLMPAFARSWREMPTADALATRALIDYGFIIERLLGRPVDLPMRRIVDAPEDQRADVLVDFLSSLPELAGVSRAELHRRVDVYWANLAAMFAYRPDGGVRTTFNVISVGGVERGEQIVDPDSPYAAALRATPPDKVIIDHVDAEASTLFDCAEPHMSAIGAVLHSALSAAVR